MTSRMQRSHSWLSYPGRSSRENIWLYGRTLGMNRADIGRRFADIVGILHGQTLADLHGCVSRTVVEDIDGNVALGLCENRPDRIFNPDMAERQMQRDRWCRYRGQACEFPNRSKHFSLP